MPVIINKQLAIACRNRVRADIGAFNTAAINLAKSMRELEAQSIWVDEESESIICLHNTRSELQSICDNVVNKCL